MRLPPVCPARLLAHLISQEEQGWGYRDPKRLGGLKVDDQIECPVLLHGDVAHLDPLEDFVHLGCQAGRIFLLLRPIGKEATSLPKLPVMAYGWEPIPDHQCPKPREVSLVSCDVRYQDSVGACSSELPR